MSTRLQACLGVAALSVVVFASGCGGGGGGGSAPNPPPASNRPPVLTTTTVSTSEDVGASVQLAATDPDGHPVTFTISANPQHGTATLTAAGALTYQPTPNYSGADTLGVAVSDTAGAQASGTIAISITAVNDPPTLSSTAFSVNEDASLSAQLTGTDIEGDAFTYQLLPGAGNGDVTLDPAGALTYAPHANFSGSDQVRVRLIETVSGAALPEQIVAIDVLPQNDAPTATDDTLRVTVTPGQPITVPTLANDVDIDGDALTPTVIAQPRGGTITVNATTRQLTFEPANGYVGPIEFTYRVNDGHVDSNVATVRAVIGDFQDLLFLSDYTHPGVTELHRFDGLQVERVSDSLSPGANVISYAWSGDLAKVAYVVDGNDAMRVFVKRLDGATAAELRYTSALKTPPANRTVAASLNADGTFMTVWDQWSGPAKQYFMVNVATGATTRIAGAMPGIVDVRFAIFHPWEPTLVMVQGQTAGAVPRDNTAATTAFLGDASDMSTLTQIGRTYASGQYGAGEGFYYGSDPRFIYHAEYLNNSNATTTLLSYDRTNQVETPVGPIVLPSDRGMNGTAWTSPDASRLCFAYYQPGVTAYLGPSRFYSMSIGNPSSAAAITPELSRTTQCTYASDNRTMLYRTYTANFASQQVFAVDSQAPGTPRSLAPAAEAVSEQAAWMFAHAAMTGTIAFFDDDGAPGFQGQTGRLYSIPLGGSGTPFLFSDDYLYPSVSTFFYDLDDAGDFLLYSRPNGGKSSLELMSTHVLNLSIPLSLNEEAVGVVKATWLQRYP